MSVDGSLNPESRSSLKVSSANTASHDVAGDWPECSRLFFRNPATGAVEVRPEKRDEMAISFFWNLDLTNKVAV